MTITKCLECGQEISNEAKMCPHCGKLNIPIVIEHEQQSENPWKGIVRLSVIGLIGIGLYVWSQGVPLTMTQLGLKNVVQPAQTNSSGQAIPLQEVKNLGYDFFIGQIDYPNTDNLTDDIKNQITKIVYDAHFPESMLKNIPIIILNNLALSGDQYIPTAGGNLKVPDLKADFLSEGGLYVTFDNGSLIIFINKPIIIQGKLTEVLTHELGHAIGSTLTDQDWGKYYQLRSIPINTVRHSTNWILSPEEDFAEIYKNTFTGIDVRTNYGPLINQNSEKTFSQLLAKKKAQANQIRNALFSSTTKYSVDSIYTVSQATKDFMVDIVNRLNHK